MAEPFGTRRRGVVIRYFADRRFGFLEDQGPVDGKGRSLGEVFFHVADYLTGWDWAPQPGEVVEYTLRQSQKGDGRKAVELCPPGRLGEGCVHTFSHGSGCGALYWQGRMLDILGEALPWRVRGKLRAGVRVRFCTPDGAQPYAIPGPVAIIPKDELFFTERAPAS